MPFSAGTASTLCPVSSMDPASWALMCPVSALMTLCQGRRAAEIRVALVGVPPTMKWT